ncbi:hypothetical protein ACPOM7_18110 [Peribacillus castrilensis]|uniref:hypothetical protein n=1 Tax=Peribacillus TaxID=2675229 RepID=UPI00209EC7D4|nr:hypothetical protein [Peribacillus frigoritolerans]MCP1097303.1 hypothetical protein [Bacillaceae bacterium OS4b]MCP1154725.1 hypothetical protein [Peribacillus frigoritolerans]
MVQILEDGIPNEVHHTDIVGLQYLGLTCPADGSGQGAVKAVDKAARGVTVFSSSFRVLAGYGFVDKKKQPIYSAVIFLFHLLVSFRLLLVSFSLLLVSFSLLLVSSGLLLVSFSLLLVNFSLLLVNSGLLLVIFSLLLVNCSLLVIFSLLLVNSGLLLVSSNLSCFLVRCCVLLFAGPFS